MPELVARWLNVNFIVGFFVYKWCAEPSCNKFGQLELHARSHVSNFKIALAVREAMFSSPQWLYISFPALMCELEIRSERGARIDKVLWVKHCQRTKCSFRGELYEPFSAIHLPGNTFTNYPTHTWNPTWQPTEWPTRSTWHNYRCSHPHPWIKRCCTADPERITIPSGMVLSTSRGFPDHAATFPASLKVTFINPMYFP